MAEIAAKVCKTPIALASFIDKDRQWFKAKVGLDVAETPREQAFCAHAILDSEGLIVQDATLYPRFENNPLVKGDPEIRFYAGVPVKLEGESALGTICVIDRNPRILDWEQMEVLHLLARQAELFLKMRVQS